MNIEQRVFEHRNVEFAVTVLQFLKGNFLCRDFQSGSVNSGELGERNDDADSKIGEHKHPHYLMRKLSLNSHCRGKIVPDFA